MTAASRIIVTEPAMPSQKGWIPSGEFYTWASCVKDTGRIKSITSLSQDLFLISLLPYQAQNPACCGTKVGFVLVILWNMDSTFSVCCRSEVFPSHTKPSPPPPVRLGVQSTRAINQLFEPLTSNISVSLRHFCVLFPHLDWSDDQLIVEDLSK